MINHDQNPVEPPPLSDGEIQPVGSLFPANDEPDVREWLRGADIEMWMSGKGSPDRRFVRPSRIRVNGAELVFCEDDAPFATVHDFGSRTHPLKMDLRGILVRSLKVHPVDPAKPGPQTYVTQNITVTNNRSAEDRRGQNVVDNLTVVRRPWWKFWA